MRSVSNNARAAMYASQTNQVFLELITISHDDLATPIRLVNNNVAITSLGYVYSPGAFTFTPPVEEDGSIQSASMSIANTDRLLVEAVRSISSAPLVSVSIIRAAEPDTIEAGPWEFYMREITYDMQRVSGSLIPDSPLRRYASNVYYRNTTFPGLYG